MPSASAALLKTIGIAGAAVQHQDDEADRERDAAHLDDELHEVGPHHRLHAADRGVDHGEDAHDQDADRDVDAGDGRDRERRQEQDDAHAAADLHRHAQARSRACGSTGWKRVSR